MQALREWVETRSTGLPFLVWESVMNPFTILKNGTVHSKAPGYRDQRSSGGSNRWNSVKAFSINTRFNLWVGAAVDFGQQSFLLLQAAVALETDQGIENA